MTATPDPNAVEAARLRLAQEVLDELPSPKVRAAVMRAAAEAAGHGAVEDAVAPVRPSAGRWLRSWLRRSHDWGPMAATAGATAVALLAVGVAFHVDREASTEPASRAAAPSASPPSAKARALAPTPPSPAKAPSTASSPAVAPATAGSRAIAPSTAGSPAIAPATAGQPAMEPSAAGPPAAAGPRDQIEEAKPQDALNAPRPMMQAPAMGTAAPQAAPPGAAATEARSSNAAQTARMKAFKESVQPSLAPDDWLRRIIELRRAGRGAEADQELARFRAAYPNAIIPADALK